MGRPGQDVNWDNPNFFSLVFCNIVIFLIFFKFACFALLKGIMFQAIKFLPQKSDVSFSCLYCLKLNRSRYKSLGSVLYLVNGSYVFE